MSYTGLDATGATKYFEADGAGTSGDPFAPIVIADYQEVAIFNAGGTNGAADSTSSGGAEIFTFSSGTNFDLWKFASDRSILVVNSYSGGPAVFRVFISASGSGSNPVIYSESIAAGAWRYFSAHANDASASSTIIYLPQLRTPYLGKVTITTDAAVVSGSMLVIGYVRR